MSRKKKAKIKSYTVTIFGDEWTIEVLPDDVYDKRHGKDSLGIMEGHIHRINLRESSDNRETLIHEVCHAFLSYQSLEDLDISGEEWEEVYCTFVAKNFEKMYAVLKELGAI